MIVQLHVAYEITVEFCHQVQFCEVTALVGVYKQTIQYSFFFFRFLKRLSIISSPFVSVLSTGRRKIKKKTFIFFIGK